MGDPVRVLSSLRISAAGPSAPRAKGSQADRVALLDRQQDLLIELVEASRRGAGAARRKFLLAITPTGDRLLHPGLPSGELSASEDDVEALAESGLVKATRPRRDTISFTLTPLGVAHYEALRKAARERVARVESDVRLLLQSEDFRRRYPAAYANWAAAESQLSRESGPDIRQTARFCREAMDGLAAALVERVRPPGVSGMPEDSIYRLKAVVGQREGRLGSARMALIDALLDYWSNLADLVEREEDGPRRTDETAAHARSLVLQTLVVLLEVDRLLSQ